MASLQHALSLLLFFVGLPRSQSAGGDNVKALVENGQGFIVTTNSPPPVYLNEKPGSVGNFFGPDSDYIRYWWVSNIYHLPDEESQQDFGNVVAHILQVNPNSEEIKKFGSSSSAFAVNGYAAAWNPRGQFHDTVIPDFDDFTTVRFQDYGDARSNWVVWELSGGSDPYGIVGSHKLTWVHDVNDLLDTLKSALDPLLGGSGLTPESFASLYADVYSSKHPEWTPPEDEKEEEGGGDEGVPSSGGRQLNRMSGSKWLAALLGV